MTPCASTTPKPNKAPLVAVLKNEKLELVREVELPAEMLQFPDMIELEHQYASAPDVPYQTHVTVRQFFRIGITDRKAFYRKGVSYRIQN